MPWRAAWTWRRSGSRWRGRRRPRTRRGRSRGSSRSGSRSRAASTDRTTPARRGRSCPATPRCGDAAGTSSTSPSIRRTPTSSTCRTSRCRDRRTAARRGCRCAARPAATTTSSRGSRRTTPNTMIVASDQGTIITRNATADDPRDVTWSSWLNQPTAQIYHLSVDYRFPYWVTGAQQDSGAVAVRSRGKFANISMRDWEPIGAGGESGMTAGDPLHPGIVFGGAGTRCDLETQPAAADDSASQPGAGANGLDAAARVLEGRSARALLRESVPLQDDRRRADVDADQSGPDASRSRHPRQPRRGRRTRHRSQRQARRDLHRRAVAAQRADDLDRHRRRR